MFESLLTQTADPAGRLQRLLPLLLQPCELPPRMRFLTYADFTNPAEWEAQFARVIATIKGEDAPSAPVPAEMPLDALPPIGPLPPPRLAHALPPQPAVRRPAGGPTGAGAGPDRWRDGGDLAGARPYLEQALEIKRQALGEEHADTAQILKNLCGLLKKMGDNAGARLHYGQALAIYQRRLSPDHPNTKVVRAHLEQLLTELGA